MLLLATLASMTGCAALTHRDALTEPPLGEQMTIERSGSAAAGRPVSHVEQASYTESSQIMLSDVPQHNPLPPTELAPVSLPAYRIEPPDVLLIDAIRMAPKHPYSLKTMDVLQVFVVGTLPDQPIGGAYQIEPSGMVNLGPAYGAVSVKGKRVDEAADAIREHLQNIIAAPDVSVSLLQTAGQQTIAGEHMVAPDGTVTLGIYGKVYVTNMTTDEAREVIEQHLSKFLDEPEVSVDMFAYNSKKYYIITEGAGLGDQVVPVPITGNEHVLDAISQIGGLQRVSSKKIQIARPAPSGMGCDQILPVDWMAITKGGATGTNYQLMPGDRVFIAEDRMVAFDGLVSKVTQPFERMLGFSLLGAQTIQALQRFPEGQRLF